MGISQTGIRCLFSHLLFSQHYTGDILGSEIFYSEIKLLYISLSTHRQLSLENLFTCIVQEAKKYNKYHYDNIHGATKVTLEQYNPITTIEGK